jgi:hypothetical protein
MPRITVTTDTTPQHGEPTVLLDEQVQSVHLSTGHAAAQLVERLGWAVIDAEQQGPTRTPAPGHEQTHVRDVSKDAKRPTPLRPLRRVVVFTGVHAG